MHIFDCLMDSSYRNLQQWKKNARRNNSKCSLRNYGCDSFQYLYACVCKHYVWLFVLFNFEEGQCFCELDLVFQKNKSHHLVYWTGFQFQNHETLLQSFLWPGNVFSIFQQSSTTSQLNDMLLHFQHSCK